MKITNLSKKIKYIRDTLLEIISRLNLAFNKKANFKNLATVLHENNLINENYYQKIVTLDSINEKDLGSLESLKIELNDIQLYLEMRFYHYI